MTFLAGIVLDAFISDRGIAAGNRLNRSVNLRWIAGVWSFVKKGIVAYGTARAENAIRHHHVF